MNRRSIFTLAILFAFVSIFSFQTNAQGLAIGATAADFSLPDLNGTTQTLNGLKGEKGTVVIWLSAQCPVVKQYNERINQIADEYKAKGINFIGINSNSTESLDYVKSNVSEVGYKFPVLIDKDNVLADLFGANVTPEIFYFNEKNVLLYHGAIDNDKSGENITTNLLRDAFDLTLAGKAVAKTTYKATGCSIKRVKKG
ncbi:MAG TPA: thioredoxin family protein [Pyrinomonadaceae bacterium]|nr:thioredoxin family protein [Pyrinomonadaceae bacterium]